MTIQKFAASVLAWSLLVSVLSLVVSMPPAAAAGEASLAATVIADGSAPFGAAGSDGVAGYDENDSNGIVRAFDVNTYRLEYSNDGGQQLNNAFLVATASSDSSWAAMPAGCGTGSTRSGLVLRCALGTVDVGTSGSIEGRLRPDAATPEGTLLNVTLTLEADEVTAPAPSVVSANTIVTGAWKYDLSLSNQGFTPITMANGEAGFRYSFRVFIFNGERARGLRPLHAGTTTDITISRLNSQIEQSEVTCVNGSGNVPVTCVVDPATGVLTYTMAGGRNAAWNRNDTFASTVTIEAPLSTLDDTSPGIRADASELVTVDSTGAVVDNNYNNTGGDPLTNNAVNANVNTNISITGEAYVSNTTLDYIDQVGVNGSQLDNDVRTWSGHPHGRSVDSTTPAGGRNRPINRVKQNAFITPSNVYLCTGFDNTLVPITANPHDAAEYAKFLLLDDNSGAVTAADWVIEFGTGINGGIAGTWADSGDIKAAVAAMTCGNSDSADGWVTNPTTLPGGLGSVTKVRMRQADPAQLLLAGSTDVAFQFYNRMVDTAVVGDIAYYSHHHCYTHDGNETCVQIARQTRQSAANIGSGTLNWGPTPIFAGTQSSYRALWSVQTVQEVDEIFVKEATNTVMTTYLPAGATYVSSGKYGSFDEPPVPTVTVEADGRTKIEYSLGDVTISSSGGAIVTFDTDPLLADGTAIRPTATIGATNVDDTSLSGNRSGIVVNQSASLAVSNSPAAPVIADDADAQFTLGYANVTAGPIDALDIITILPFDGSSVGTQTAARLELADVMINNGEDVYVSAVAPLTLDALDGSTDSLLDPGHADFAASSTPWYEAPGTGNWTCTLAQSQASAPGCPALADVTAIRIVGPGTEADPFLAAGVTSTVDIVLDADTTTDGDVLVQRFAGRTDTDITSLALVPQNTISVVGEPLLLKTVSNDTIAGDTQVDFSFTVGNPFRAGSPIADPLVVNLADTLPEGFTVASVDLNGATGTDNTTVGSDALSVTGLAVPPESTVTVDVTADIATDVAPGDKQNQATLSSLPAIFRGISLPSDDPTEPGLADPTEFTVVSFPRGVCDAGIHLSTNNPSTLNRVDTTTTPFALSALGTAATRYDGIGFNLIDGFFYGWDHTNDEIVRINADGQTQGLGVPAGMDAAIEFDAGDMDAGGNLYLGFGGGGGLSQIWRIDLATFVATELSANTTQVGSSEWSVHNGFSDMSFNPADGNLYLRGIGGNDIYWLSTAENGDRTYDYYRQFPADVITGPLGQGMITVGQWFDGNGDLYFYRNNGSTYRVSMPSRVSELVSTGAPVTGGDAARCAYQPGLTKLASTNVADPGDTVTYTFEISNPLPVGSVGDPLTVDLTDAMPAGMEIDKASLAVTGATGYTDSTVDGSSDLTLTGIGVPSASTVTVVVDALVPAAATIGDYTNQATLSGLPTGLGNSLLSDDPTLPGFLDPTPLTIGRVDLAVSKTSSGYHNGNDITYTIAVTNEGTAPVAGATVTDTFPANVTGVTWTCVAATTDSTCTASGTGDITDSVDLAAGDTVTYTATGTTAADANTLTNTASAAVPVGVDDADDTNDSSTVIDRSSFECTADFYTISGGSNLFQMNTATNPFSQVLVADLGLSVLSLGYNPVDNFMYAISDAAGTIRVYRIGSDGIAVDTGATVPVPGFALGISDTGVMAIRGGTASAPIRTYDLTDPAVPLLDTATTTFGANADLAYNPIDGLLYSVTTSGNLIKIAADGAHTIIATSGTTMPGGQSYGGVFFDSAGNLYAVNSSSGNFYRAEFNADNTSAVISFVSGSTAIPSDAASCATAASPMAIPGVAKDMTSSGNGPWTVDIDFTVGNTGDDILSAMSMEDDLEAVFGTPGTAWEFTSISKVSGPTNFTINSDFDGETGGDTEIIGATSELLPGETAVVRVAIQLNTPGNYSNTVTLSGESKLTGEDLSDDSTAADIQVLPPFYDLSISKTDGVTEVDNGGTVTYTIVARNIGPEPIDEVFVLDEFPAEATCSTTSVATGGATGNVASFDGDIDETLALPAGANVTYTAVCDVFSTTSVTMTNTATISTPVTSSENPPADAPEAPNTATDTTDIVVDAGLDITKTVGIPTAAASGTSGNVDVPFTVVVTNDGNIAVDDIEVSDALATQFGDVFVDVVSGPAVTGDLSGANNDFDGDTDTELLASNPTAQLGADESFTVTFTVELDPDAVANPALTNVATVNAKTLGGVAVEEPSTPAQVWISQLETDKVIVSSGPSLATAGAVDVTYAITVTNTGNRSIDDLVVTDDLDAQFASAFVDVLGDPVVTGDLDPTRANGGFDGETDINLLTSDASDSLAAGEAFTVTFDVTIDPDAPNAASPLENAASVTGNPPPSGPPVIVPPEEKTPLDATALDVAKTASQPIDAASGIVGNVDVTYTITLTNSGTTNVDDIAINDNLATQFGAGFVGVTTAPAVTGDLASTRSNASYNGGVTPSADANLLTTDPADSLAPGEQAEITFTVELDPDAGASAHHDCHTTGTGSVTVMNLSDGSQQAYSTSTNVFIDVSDGIPSTWTACSASAFTNVAEATGGGEGPFVTPPNEISNPSLLTTKSAGEPVAAASGVLGNVEVTYTVTVMNNGSTALSDLSVTDDLDDQFGAAFVAIVGDPVVSGSLDADRANVDYDGHTIVDVLTGDDSETLEAGESFTVTFTAELDPDADGAAFPLDNVATATGTPPGGAEVSETSEPTPTEISQLETNKQLSAAGPSSETLGAVDVEYTIEVTNTGSTSIDDIQLVDDLATQFGDALVAVIDGPVAEGDLAATRANVDYDGAGDINLLTGDAAEALAAGESFTVTFTVTVDPGHPNAPSPLGNAASVTGTPPPTGPPILLPPEPELPLEARALTLAKTAAEPVAASSGTLGNVDVTFTLELRNTGTEPIGDLSITDDLSAQLGNALVAVIDAPAVTGDLSSTRGNTDFDGSVDVELLTADTGEELQPGGVAIVAVTVELDPDADADALPLTNVAEASGTGAGLVTNPPAPIAVKSLFAAKSIADQANAASGNAGNIDVTYRFVVLNNGSEAAVTVNLTDNLQGQLGSAFVGITAEPTVTNIDSTTLPAANADYDGTGALVSGAALVEPSQSFIVDVTVELDPDAAGAPAELSNVGEISGSTTHGPIPSRPTTPGGNPEGGDPEPVVLMTPGIAAIETLDVDNNGDGTYSVAIGFEVVNTGDVELDDVNIELDLATTFAAAESWQVESVSSPTFSINDSYDGTGAENLLRPLLNRLGSGERGHMTVVLTVTPGANPEAEVTSNAADLVEGYGSADLDDDSVETRIFATTVRNLGQFMTQGIASGRSIDGVYVADLTGSSVGNDEPLALNLLENFDFAGAKEIVSVERNTNGTADFTYRIHVKNLGNVEVGQVQVLDDLTETFPGHSFEVRSVVADGLSANTAFDGDADTKLLVGTDMLSVGGEATIDLVVRVHVTSAAASFENIAYLEAVSPSGVEGRTATIPGSQPESDGVAEERSTVADLQSGEIPLALAFTGSNIFRAIVLGFLLIALGAAVIAGRRRFLDHGTVG